MKQICRENRINSRIKRGFALLTAALMIIPLLSGCTRREPYTFTSFAFDTIIQITYWDGGKEVQERCMELCAYYESLFSRTEKTSDIARINSAKGAPTEVDAETAALIKEALRYSEMTEGAFDISTLPLSLLWNVTAEDPVIPDEDAVARVLCHVDYRKILVEGTTVTLLDPEMQIDLGGIAKGYIARKLSELLSDMGISHALINLGGNVVAIGGDPDGDPFSIGLQEPFAANGTAIMNVPVTSGCVVTSGSYERYFESGGELYHHIMDPASGAPAKSGLRAVTILCEDPVMADALSTSCFVLGLEKSTALIKTLGISAVFIDEDNQITKVK